MTALILTVALLAGDVRVLLRGDVRGSIYAVAPAGVEATRKIWQGNDWGLAVNTDGADSASGAALVDGRIILISRKTERKLWLKRMWGRAKILVPAEF